MFDKIQTIIHDECGVAREDIVPEADLRGDLGIDSMAAVNLSFEIENAFGIVISDEELATLTTVADIVALVEAKQEKPND